MKQPKNFREVVQYLYQLGDVKSGFKSMQQNGCRPCELCEMDVCKMAKLLQDEREKLKTMLLEILILINK